MATATVIDNHVLVNYSGPNRRNSTLRFFKEDASDEDVFNTVHAIVRIQDFTGITSHKVHRIIDTRLEKDA